MAVAGIIRGYDRRFQDPFVSESYRSRSHFSVSVDYKTGRKGGFSRQAEVYRKDLSNTKTKKQNTDGATGLGVRRGP